MTLTDFVWVAVGETLLAGTFAFGILVGISLSKRISNDNDTRKATAGKDSGWYHAGNGGSAAGNGDGKGGGGKRQ
jgi:hypothetical protein